MRVIVLRVGQCLFLEENESCLRFKGAKYGGLWNVRPPIIDPLVTSGRWNQQYN